MAFTQNWIAPTEVDICPSDTPVSIINVSNPSGGNFVFTKTTTGGTAPYTYFWTITPSGGVTVNSGYSGSVFDVTISVEGSYTVKLFTTDSLGSTHIASKTVSYVLLGYYSDSYDQNYQ